MSITSRQRLVDAIARLAASVECGELMAATDPAGFLDEVAARHAAALERVAELEARIGKVRELRDSATDGRFFEAMRLVLRILEAPPSQPAE